MSIDRCFHFWGCSEIRESLGGSGSACRPSIDGWSGTTPPPGAIGSSSTCGTPPGFGPGSTPGSRNRSRWRPRSRLAAERGEAPVPRLRRNPGVLQEPPARGGPPGRVVELLTRLSDRPSDRVVLVSGRPRAQLDPWFGSIEGLWLAAPSFAPRARRRGRGSDLRCPRSGSRAFVRCSSTSPIELPEASSKKRVLSRMALPDVRPRVRRMARERARVEPR
jgi:hypothetical protein